MTRPRGRPRFEPTADERKQVELAAAWGLDDARIARLIRPDRGGLSERSLQNHFRIELSRGRATGDAKLAQTAFMRATSGGSDRMLEFLCETRLRWSKRQAIELSGPDGVPLMEREAPRLTIVQEQVVQLESVSDAALVAEVARRAARAPAGSTVLQ
jgi:hypothetical protein